MIFSFGANATVIDFEEFTTNNFYDSVDTNGYSITGDPFYIGSGLGNGGSYGMGVLADVELTLTNESASLFSLVSIDAISFSPSQPLTVTGYYAVGGEITTTLSITGGSVFTDMLTYNFSNAWQGLSAVTFLTNDNMNMDNLVVAAVPIPAAVWLFGSALAGLGWLRRKQTI